MSDVFSRLFKDSVKMSKVNKAQSKMDAFKMEEDEKWKLKLAAGCYLVDQNPPMRTQRQERAIYSSLSSFSLHHKKPVKKQPQAEAKTILSQNRRCISTIMDNVGSVSRTDNYIITDSVEPPPYRFIKPSPFSARRYYRNNQAPHSKKVNTEYIKRELEENRMEKAKYGRMDSICTTKIDVDNSDQLQKKSNDENIMVDMDKEYAMDELPKATNLISNTGQCYQMYGYPDSLSFILQSK